VHQTAQSVISQLRRNTSAVGRDAVHADVSSSAIERSQELSDGKVEVCHMPRSGPPRQPWSNPRNEASAVFSGFSLKFDKTQVPANARPQPGRIPGFHYRHSIILRLPSMGSAPPSVTAFSSFAPQLTLVGSAFPYTSSTAGLNKTDASFASLVRQGGDVGPP
jgi:hypothetical protein